MPSTAVLVIACAGHFAVHLLLGLHATAALAIEREWSIDYGDIIALGIWGAFLLGAAAPAAGWLADKVGAARMMVLFFLGSGAASIATAMVGGPATLAMTLATLGLFGAIYHPVGLVWLLGGVAEGRRGWAVGVNGLFGSLGVAAAPAVVGLLGNPWGWRMAFLLPGLATATLGVLLIGALMRGVIPNAPVGRVARVGRGTAKSDSWRALIALAAAMLCGSVMYAAFATALPKWAEGRIEDAWPRADLGLVGIVVTAVFLVGGMGQVLAGYLADRYDARRLYLFALGAKPLLLTMAVFIGGPAALVAAAVLVLAIDVASPSESLLLARWTPTHRRGLAFGVRYAAALAATPSGIWLAAVSYGTGWGHDGLFVGLAVLATIAAFAAAAMPGSDTRSVQIVSRMG